MNDEVELAQFAADLEQEIIGRCEGEESDATRREYELTQYMVEVLTEAGELADGDISVYRARGMKIDGYSVNEERGCLDLFVTISTTSVPPRTVSRDEVDTAFRRLTVFLQQALDGLHRSLADPSTAFDMALVIYSMRADLSRVRFFVITDGLTTIERKEEGYLDNVICSYHVWDLRRMFRCLSSSRRREPIEINFETRFGATLPCLPMPAGESDYSGCLAIVPGQILYQLYDEFGPRLLERNVRSYLQVRGSVNKGIRDTILIEPHRFFAYNNGISATAEAVEFVSLEDGHLGIRCVRDLQIVNGGQTTASIYQAARKDRAAIDNVFVQMKLSVVNSEQIDEIVPLISRYANSQNKISEADFSANDPFHVAIEELSRRVWAPAVDGTQRQTHWFYERARGQYLDAKGREPTTARRRLFQLTNPPAQLFTKTDLAKFENTWAQLPHIVSRGAQKNFAEYAVRLTEHARVDVDEVYFQRLIARAILFKTAERVVQNRNYGGYRANIVTHTLAYLSYRTGQRINLDQIWRDQTLSRSLQEAIATVSSQVRDRIINPPDGRNVTEWCKREECWKSIRGLQLELPPDLLGELVAQAPTKEPARGDSGVGDIDPDSIARINAVRAETWLSIAHWARETNNLLSWQRGLAYSLGQLAARRRTPSPKQIKHGLKILERAEELGFDMGSGLANPNVRSEPV